MQLLFFIDWFKQTNGATLTVVELAELLRGKGVTCEIICEYNSSPLPSKVSLWDEKFIMDKLSKGDTVINYFHTGVGSKGGKLFDKILSLRRRNNIELPIITTVLQKPSNPSTILSPHIIKNSRHLVFIDKSAYNDNMYSFIPKSRKSMIYMSWPIQPEFEKLYKDVISTKERRDKSKLFIFGRGSAISKCPKDTIKQFQRINVDSKQLIICGVNDDTWLARQARKYNNVITLPNTQYIDWVRNCSKFDVFLYYLPKSAYSSLDGNLGLAMLLGIPPIVYGPDAPKERIIDGVNGFVAETKDQIIDYAERLYKDDELREKMGKNARSSTLAYYNSSSSIEKYMELNGEILRGHEYEPIQTPLLLSYICIYIRIKYKLKTSAGSIWRGFFLLLSSPSMFMTKLKRKVK